MNVIYIIILIGLIAIGFVFKEKVYSPLILMPITFLTLFILQDLRLYGLYTADQNSYFVCLVGVCSFYLGCFLNKILGPNPQTIVSNKKDNIFVEINEHKKMLFFLLGMAFIFILLYSWSSIGFLRSGGSLYDMRYGQQELLHSNGIISFLYTYIGVPIVYLSLPISMYDYFVAGQKIYFFLTLIVVFFWFIGNGARLPLIYVILSALCVFLLFYSKLKNDGKVKKIVFALIIAFFVIDILSVARKSGKNIAADNTTFVQGLYYYLGGSMINMGIKLPFVATKNSLFGIMTFYGIFLPISNIINIKLLGEANYFPDIVQNSIIQISSQSSQPYNFGTTGFLYLFADGKIWGVILISIVLGILAQVVYKNFCISKDLKNFILYSLVMEAILMFALTDLLSTISFTFAIIYTLVFFRPYKVGK